MSKTDLARELGELKQRLAEREADIHLLQRTFNEIGTEFNLETVFRIIAERAREIINAETLLIPILDKHCATYTYRGGAGKNAKEIVGEALPLDFGICGWVWRHKKPWWRGVLKDLTEDERNLWEKEAGSVILVPLQGPKHFLGGIAGINKIGAGDFDERDLALLSLFASVVPIAIENAMVIKEIEDARGLMEDYQLKLERINRQLSESNRELEFLSLYDPITGLPNRSLFRDRLTQHISVNYRSQSQVALLLVDLNNFKHINESLGHDQGDHLLKLIADRLKDALKDNETLCRLGGDEFILINPRLNESLALERATKILDLLDKPFKVGNTEVAVGASIGIAVYPQHGHDASTLMRHADIAMYLAKQSKRGFKVYNADEDTSSIGQLTISADLRKAFDENQFELHYQPKFNMQTRKLIGAEALGRWKHPLRGYISPSIFIHALEQSGQIDRYTYWAIATALRHANDWKLRGHDLKIAVNISTLTLMNPDFLHSLERLVNHSDNGRLLIFEITENLFLSDYERITETLALIHNFGITLSIDDFGTGYSSLSRLKKLPVSELKIDQSFIRDMNEDPDDEVIVRSTIELAHNLGLNVTAEGVELQETYLRLAQMGCDNAQGFLISKAIPADQFSVYLEKNSEKQA
jgi:diguanylate cyclase (GGDEF)-like protein